MSMQQSLAAIVLAGSVVGGAQAQSSTELTCNENQTKIVSALAGGKVVGCKDIPIPVSSTYIPQNQATSLALSEASSGKNREVYAVQYIEIDPNQTSNNNILIAPVFH